MAQGLLFDMTLFNVNLWLILIATIVLFLGATQIGFFLGRRAHKSGLDEHSRSPISTIQVAILGLLALLLGFTFATSMSRYNKRKQMA